MTPKQFDKEARAVFSTVLERYGFDVSTSQHCTFTRRTAEGIWHFVMPDPGRSGSWYDVKVFASSPAIDPMFDELFPDYLGIPLDVYCFLHPKHGVGLTHYQYHCRTPEGFRRNFDELVAGPLVEKAIPYLDSIPSLSALVPHIRSKLYLGLALAETGQNDAAVEILKAEKARLQQADTQDRKVAAFLGRISSILGTNGA